MVSSDSAWGVQEALPAFLEASGANRATSGGRPVGLAGTSSTPRWWPGPVWTGTRAAVERALLDVGAISRSAPQTDGGVDGNAGSEGAFRG